MTHQATPLMAALTLIGCCLTAAAQDLPNDKAESISGKKLDFPSALRGSIATCVFGFGKDSSDKVGVWLESLSSDNINAWSVVNLESVPAGARGVLRMTMRKGTPKELLDRSLVISKDYKEWKRILGVEKESLPVVVLFDKEGRIAWKRQGTFSSSITDELKARIAELTGK
jgi:hypothetical protein